MIKQAALASALAVSAVIHPLTAQDDGRGFDLIPANAMLVHWCQGPKALTDAFVDTRLAELLTGPELTAVLTPMLEMARQEAGQDDGPGAAALALEEALADYEGHLVAAAGLTTGQIDPSAFMYGQWDSVGMWAVCALSADGHTDLAQLQQRLSEIIESTADAEIVDLEVEGRTFQASANEGEVNVTMPFMEGDDLVIVFGSQVDEALATFLSRDGQSLADQPLTMPTSAIGVWMNLRSIWPMVDAMAAGEDPMLPEFLGAIGLRSLDTAMMSVSPSGEHVILDFDVRMNDEPQGLFSCITEIDPSPPALLDIAPVHRETWSVTKLNIGALFDSLMDAVWTMEPTTGMAPEFLLDQFETQFRVRLKEDMIDHLGDELLMVTADEPEDLFDEDAVQAQCIGIALRDAKSFAESFETMLRSRGLHAARKTEDYRGFTVRRLSVLGMLELSYAITDRAFLLGINREGAAALRTVLDEEQARDEGVARPSFSDEVADRMEHAGGAWQSLSVSTWSATIEMLAAALEQSGEVPATFSDQLDSVMAMAMGLLQRYRVDTMVNIVRVGPRRVLTRTIW